MHAHDRVVGHRIVDIGGKFDEPRLEVEFAGLPRQVKGIDGDAVPTRTDARIERLETEGFGGGCIDDAPDVDVHLVTEHRQFVHQSDIHRAIRVLEQLRHLGD